MKAEEVLDALQALGDRAEEKPLVLAAADFSEIEARALALEAAGDNPCKALFPEPWQGTATGRFPNGVVVDVTCVGDAHKKITIA